MRAGFARMLVALAALCAASEAASAQAVSEAAVKAAFVYRFTSYIEWPEAAFQPDAPFSIGVIGNDEVAAELDKVISGRSIAGRRAAVRRLAEGDSARGLHMLFIGRDAPNPRSLVRSAQHLGMLTVTEHDKGLEWGSVVNLVTSEDRVGFEVSMDAADRAGLRISSRMLAVARRVVPKA